MPCGRVFISYRRDGGADLARLVQANLERRGYDVFMDVESLRSGPFNTALFAEIESATDVVVILTPGSLDRCRNEGDWVRLEIAHAIRHKRNIIPVMARGFEWPSTSAPLPDDMAALPTYNGVSPSHEYFSASIDRLTKLLTGSPRRPRLWFYVIAATLVLALTGLAVAFAPQLRRMAAAPGTSAMHAAVPALATEEVPPVVAAPRTVGTPPVQSRASAPQPAVVSPLTETNHAGQVNSNAVKKEEVPFDQRVKRIVWEGETYVMNYRGIATVTERTVGELEARPSGLAIHPNGRTAFLHINDTDPGMGIFYLSSAGRVDPIVKFQNYWTYEKAKQDESTYLSACI